MAEFSLQAFTNSIRQNLYDRFPYESDEMVDLKHKKRPLHIRDIAFMYLPTTQNENSIMFEIGSEYAEEYYPYYHILEDAQVIRKRGRSTKGSRGSQAKIKELGKRDYGRISFNGKTYSREYRKNVRGQRSRLGTATKIVVGSDGKPYKVNPNANYYANKHYQYIERILNETLPMIAQEYGMRMGRTQLTDLSDEFQTQESEDIIMNTLSSFEV
jgi:hypothetical protein